MIVGSQWLVQRTLSSLGPRVLAVFDTMFDSFLLAETLWLLVRARQISIRFDVAWPSQRGKPSMFMTSQLHLQLLLHLRPFKIVSGSILNQNYEHLKPL